MAQHILVTEYNPMWAELFAEEAALLQRILGGNCAAIHHIGSTSVPGLAAKPIIDIMPVVYSLKAVDALSADFEGIGYEYLGAFGIAGRRYLRKGGDERTHQVHIFAQSSVGEIRRHLAVRDYLRAHKDACSAYAALKKALAQRFPFDIDGYCEGKEAFVKALEREALDWCGLQAKG